MMHIADDPLWDELWHVIATLRDKDTRHPDDTPTDDIVFEVFQVLSRRGLTGRPPAE